MNVKRFRLILLGCLMIIPLLLSSTVYAQDETLPKPGITPDSPFYRFNVWGKRIGLLFAFGPEAKAKRSLEYAEERLAEAQAMAIKNDLKGVKRAISSYAEFVAIVTERGEEARKKAVANNISEIVALATSKHRSVLDKVEDTVPGQAREAIARAKEASIKGMRSALLALAREKPERATEINLAAVGDRLNRAKAKADENNLEEVEGAINDAERLFEFGEEISEIARSLGKDTTTVEQLVAKATSIHLEVLARVYEKVPEQAKPAIERAMARSVGGHERAVEALKKKGALGEVPKEAPIPEGVKEKVKQDLARDMLAKAKLQKQATDFNFNGGTRHGTTIAPVLKGDEKVEIDGVIKTSAEWYEEAVSALKEAQAGYDAGKYEEAKEKAELAKNMFDALNNFTGQTIGFWNLKVNRKASTIR